MGSGLGGGQLVQRQQPAPASQRSPQLEAPRRGGDGVVVAATGDQRHGGRNHRLQHHRLRHMRVVQDRIQDGQRLRATARVQQEPAADGDQPGTLGRLRDVGRGLVEHGLGRPGPVKAPVQVERPDASDLRPLGIRARPRQLAGQQVLGQPRLALAHQRLSQQPFSRPSVTALSSGPAQPLGKPVVERGQRPTGRGSKQPRLGQRASLQVPDRDPHHVLRPEPVGRAGRLGQHRVHGTAAQLRRLGPDDLAEQRMPQPYPDVRASLLQ